jgi:hypothetical protein
VPGFLQPRRCARYGFDAAKHRFERIADIALEHAAGYLGAFGPHLDERIEVIEDQMPETIESVGI